MHIILNWVLHQWHCSAFCEWEQQRSCIVTTFRQCFHAVGFIQETPVPHTGAIARREAYFGQGTGPILLDNLMCGGTERRLADCPSNGIGLHNCDHTEDAGVTCQSMYTVYHFPKQLYMHTKDVHRTLITPSMDAF